MNSNLLDVAIASGLQIPVNKDIISSVEKLVPKRCFGVFVSVHRSEQQKLTTYPEDIHGCIGDWDNNYNELSGREIISKMQYVSYKATWNDNRRNYFSKPIFEDAYAKYEVFFMLTPLLDINYHTGKIVDTNEIFDNNKYGLIVESQESNQCHIFTSCF